ncbi:TraR/DksA family transcriptional regulator [Pelagibaculum spongiae]|nr:TraR/DksA C4-type zinc finger protein [Pelagibaculum spongiae]
MASNQLIQDTLDSLREQLQAELVQGNDSAAAVELDQNKVGRLSRMDAMQQQAMQQARLRSIQKRLSDIHRAEEALQHDEYGLCEECGEAISKQRMQVRPESVLCIGCAEKMEH